MPKARAAFWLTERGLSAEAEARKNLRAAYRRFMDEPEPVRKEKASKDLIRAIFGADAILENTIL